MPNHSILLIRFPLYHYEEEESNYDTASFQAEGTNNMQGDHEVLVKIDKRYHGDNSDIEQGNLFIQMTDSTYYGGEIDKETNAIQMTDNPYYGEDLVRPQSPYVIHITDTQLYDE